MIWEELKKGIYIEEDNVLIEWGTPVKKLRKIGSPEIIDQNGTTELIWHNKTILKTLNGDWRFSFFPHEIFKSFNKITQIEIGDKQATDAYKKYKEFFLNKLGQPTTSSELKYDDMQLLWENENYSVNLYFFEMHCFRCSLTISKK